MILVRSLAFSLLFYGFTTLIAILGVPLLVSKRATRWYVRRWCELMLWLLRVVGGTAVEFRGLENIPPGPLLVAAKHQSTLETIALIVPFDRFTFVLKRELMWIPVIGWYFSRLSVVPVDRSKGAKAMAALNVAAAEAVGKGFQLIIFPEGTRRPVGAPPVYKQGLSHLYRALHAPCLPVALNTGLYWRRRDFRKLPGTAVIELLPVFPAEMPRLEFQAEMQDRIETASNALVAEGLADLAARGISPPPAAEPSLGEGRTGPI